MFIVFREAPQSQQALEVFEAKFDLPADSIQFEGLASAEKFLGDRRENQDEFG